MASGPTAGGAWTTRARGFNRRAPARGIEPDLSCSPFERQPIEDVWALYRRGGDDSVGDYLALKYQYLVWHTAKRVCAALPNEVDIEDMACAGQFGLLAAIKGYDPQREVRFETYCAQRIRGAMIDELRTTDLLSRGARRRHVMMKDAIREFAQQHGRPPTRDELRAALPVGDEEFLRIERDHNMVDAVGAPRPVRQAGGSEEGRSREIDVSRDDDTDNPLRRAERRDLQDLITRGLSRAERLIVILYYFEGLTMREIGETLDLSESRVSQMHTSIVQRLKAQMRRRAGELEPER